jgi:pantoate--beta-alanine ligase
MNIRVLQSAAEVSGAAESARASGLCVGLVPTMGALHAGHRSLVERASQECGFVVATIFVNPLQFNDPADLAAYPRTIDADLEVLEQASADLAFVPSVPELYPDDPSDPAVTVRVAGLTGMLEGAHRPGHFDGVTTVVAKLFAIAGHCRAYFGEKDFQQLAVVRRMSGDLRFPVEVVGCPTVREPDGLAISSRNVRLSPDERRSATVLYRALSAAASAVRQGEDRPYALEETMRRVISSEPGVEPEYTAAVDPQTLRAPPRLLGDVRLLVAARVGAVRLIDNVGARVGASAAGNVDRFEQVERVEKLERGEMVKCADG